MIKTITFTDSRFVRWPTSVIKASRYWISIQPVAIKAREMARSVVFRRGFAGLWCHVTFHWSMQCLTIDNYKKEK